MWGGRGEVKVVSVGPRGQRIAGWPAATSSQNDVTKSPGLENLCDKLFR